MRDLLFASLVSSSALLGLTACDSGSSKGEADQAPAASAAKAATGTPKAEAAPAPTAAPEPAPAPKPAMELAPQDPDRAARTVDRTRFPDPDWFKPEILPNSTVKSQGFGAPLEDGTFSSALLLESNAELSNEDCMDTLKKGVGDAVGEWAVQSPEKTDRITMRAESDRYFVTLVCGNVKGKATASVNYTWTK